MKNALLVSLIPLLLAGCGSKGTVRRETVIGKEVIPVVMPSGETVQHPTHGKEEWFAIGPVEGLNDTKANGVAEVHVFEDKASLVNIRANIEEIRGFRLVAWVTLPDGTRMRLGDLTNPMKDVRHQLIADLPDDLTGVTTIQLVKEAPSGGKETDPVVAEGKLIRRER